MTHCGVCVRARGLVQDGGVPRSGKRRAELAYSFDAFTDLLLQFWLLLLSARLLLLLLDVCACA